MKNYTIITAAYWAFTITDGALRMLVLLHLHGLGYSSLEIAGLFLFYETFGVITNLLGGWLGSRFGLKITLTGGLTLQVCALGLMAQDILSLSTALVLIAQATSGMAKDLTKMSSKSYIKLLIPASNEKGLMKWVAILTGSKNTLKGAGFFVGGFLLQSQGFSGACQSLLILVALALFISATLLPPASGKAKKSIRLRELLTHSRKIKRLALARFFLFGSRDAWFALALPLFLSTSLQWSFEKVGAFLAAWVIGYGIVQSLVPSFARPSQDQVTQAKKLARWTTLLLLPLCGTLVALNFMDSVGPALVLALLVFGAVFAVNSAIHSYMIVSFADEHRIAPTIGFYYMANALGRLFGTIVSGAAYQAYGGQSNGLSACLILAMVFVIGAGLSTRNLGQLT